MAKQYRTDSQEKNFPIKKKGGINVKEREAHNYSMRIKHLAGDVLKVSILV